MRDGSEIHSLVLDSALTIRDIEPVRGRIMAALGSFDAVTIDCRSASEIDLSLVQLLLAARCSARAAGKTLTLFGPVDGPLLDVLARGGFLGAAEPSAAAVEDFWRNGVAAE
ncbi:MAG TPA: STAS domain-containing protein [Aliidongia sp.]|nr:STAS domain-containing protein [Aliidongia sp.]